MKTPGEQSLLEFPCRFPIKAMGKTSDEFEALVTRIVQSHAELWPGEPVRLKASKGGAYQSATLVITATSQAQLDAIYQELTDCDSVLMAL
jgi:putative lipoic acid-binding regulatory protein